MASISIIVPVYNVEQYIAQCLNSILQQTWQDWECICIDDGSSDASGTILERYPALDSRFQVFHQKNSGVSAARKLGVDVSKGQYLMFVDGDDALAPDALERLLSVMKLFHADIVRASHLELAELPDILPASFDSGNIQIVHGIQIWPHIYTSAHLWASLFQRNLFRDNALFPPVSVPIGEDALTYFKATEQAERICIISDKLYYYRNRSSSVSHMLPHYKEKLVKASLLHASYIDQITRQYGNRFCVAPLRTIIVRKLAHSILGNDIFKHSQRRWRALYKRNFLFSLSTQFFLLKHHPRTWLRAWFAFHKLLQK